MCIKSEFKGICLKLATSSRSDKGFLLTSKVVPQGFSALAPMLYICIKSLKMCRKSDFEEIILKLATYGQREKAFLLSSKFCPQWIVCFTRGYIHTVKHEKNVYKIGLQSNIFFKPATNGQSDKGFLLTSKVCPQGVLCPCPGAIYIYKIKNVYKTRFLFLNLQRLGKVIRAFC